MHIAIASHSTELGGAEMAMTELAGLLVQRGHRVSVLHEGDGPLVQRIQASGAETMRVPLRFWTGGARPTMKNRLSTMGHLAIEVPRLAAVLRKLGPTLAVTNTVTIPGLALAARLTGVAHMWMVHEWLLAEQGLQPHFGRRWTFRAVGHLSDAVVAPSRSLAAALAPLSGRDRTTHLYQSVAMAPVERRPRNGDATIRVLALGAIVPAKHQEEAILAVHRARCRGTEMRLTLIGAEDIAYGRKLRALAQGLGIADAVCFRGPVQGAAEAFADHDVLVLCSRHEAFGRVVVEALKAEVAVVAAESPAARELLGRGSGRTYTPGDPDELATQLALAHTVDTRRAREWAEADFADDTYACRFESIAASALQRQKGK